MTQQTPYAIHAGNPAVNYERHFVPAVAGPLARHLVELAQLRPGERVVDVACGTGVVTRLAAERVGGTVVGVDVHPGMLAVARSIDAGAAIEWHQASAEALPLEDESFDVALCQMGLQFCRDRSGALREMARVLEPGGRVAINLPGPTPRAMAVTERALRRHVAPEAGAFVSTVFSLHDTEEVGGLLEAAGFTDVQARSERRTLRVGAPADFLWQYLHSTPLAEAAGRLDDATRAALEAEVVAGQEADIEHGELVMEIAMTSATGRRP